MKTTVQNEPRPSVEAAKPANYYLVPDVNISETPDGYVLTAEMPGVNKTGLEVTLEGQQLTIAGRRDANAPNAEVIFRESRRADYRRAFELDPSIDVGKISAQMDQGVLTLRLPKAERVKPRKIPVAD